MSRGNLYNFIYHYILTIGIMFLLIFCLSLGLWAKYFKNDSHGLPERKAFAIINNKKIFLEIARTEAEKNKGLSFRESLPENTGMLFVFDNFETRYFWMKNMKFNIDIFWIKTDANSGTGKILGISQNIPAPTSTEKNAIDELAYATYPSPLPVDMVLETNAGFAQKNKIRIGNEIKFVLK